MSNVHLERAHVGDRLEAYHAGALAAAEAAQVEQHLGGCAVCREQSEHVALYRFIRAAPAPTAGPELRQRLYARIAEAQAAEASAHAEPAQGRARLRSREAADSWQPGRRHSAHVAGGWVSGIAATLLIAALVGVFWALPQMRQSGKRATHHTAPTIACPASQTTADLPVHVALHDLAMTSATNGWAVGEIDNGQGQPQQGVILRYSACHWSQVALDLKDIGLQHISMDSSTDGWASGTWAYGSPNYASQGMVLLHYSGGAWSVVPAAQRPANNGGVSALVMRTADDGWIITDGPENIPQGPYLSKNIQRLWRYQGGSWTLIGQIPLDNTLVMAAAGPDDVWISGSSFVGQSKLQAWSLTNYHDGAWTKVTSPGGMVVSSFHAVSPTDIWASGTETDTSSYIVVAHYDGVSWSLAPQVVMAIPTQGVIASANTTQPPRPGEYGGELTITGDDSGWAHDWKLVKVANDLSPFGEAAVAHLYLEVGGKWQSLNWPYSDVGSIYPLTALPDGEVWAMGGWQTYSSTTPLPGGGGTQAMTYHSYLLHYVDGQWTRYSAAP